MRGRSKKGSRKEMGGSTKGQHGQTWRVACEDAEGGQHVSCINTNTKKSSATMISGKLQEFMHR